MVSPGHWRQLKQGIPSFQKENGPGYNEGKEKFLYIALEVKLADR